MANLLAYSGNIIGGGGSSSGGHVIENSSGTDLTQRDTLKFTGGLKATDDSTNGKTVIDDTPTRITWTAWNQLTPQEQAAIPKAVITGAPDTTCTADNVSFNNTGTTLSSTNVQDALEEIDSKETSVNIFDNGYLTAVKYGKVVKVTIIGNGITNKENWNVVLGNIRPKKAAVGLVSDLSNGTLYWLRLDTGNDITIISLTGSEQQSKVIGQACGELTFIAE